MERKTQADVILSHLLEHGSITPRDAVYHYSVMRLAAVIFKLKKRGFNIKTIARRAESAAFGPCWYAEYKLGD